MNSKQRRTRDRSRAGYAKHWALVDRRHSRDVLRCAREAGVPWRIYAAEVASIKQRIADDLAKLYPLKVPRDVPKIEDVVREAIRAAESREDVLCMPAHAIHEVIVL